MCKNRFPSLQPLAALVLAATLAAPALAQEPRPAVAQGEVVSGFAPATLVESTRPPFPRSATRPKLVLYPGMPTAEQPGRDWAPAYGLWRLPVRVSLDERGVPVDATIGDHPLSRQGMVRRYERIALQTARAWTFSPATLDGRPVGSELELAFFFDTAIAPPPMRGNIVQRTTSPTLAWNAASVRYATRR